MADAVENRRVVIIAGASTGLGRGVAIELASKAGYSLSLCARRQDKLDKTRDKCIKAGLSPDQVICVCADLVKPDDCHKLVDVTVNRFGSIYGFVTLIGLHICPDHITNDNIMEIYDKTFSVNVAATLFMTHLLVPHLEQSKGVVVNISDTLAIHPVFDFLVTSVHRASIDCMTKGLAHNLGHKGIRFFAINAGVVRTGIMNTILPKMSQEADDAIYESFGSLQVLPNKGRPEDIAKSIAFLLSDDACFMTGVCLPVDAGFSLPYLGESVTVKCAGN